MNGISIAATGRVMTEPEQKFTSAGKQMLTFSVIVDETHIQTDDRPAPEPTWLRCTVWEEQAAALGETMRKGASVYVEGRLRHGKWQTARGADRCGLNVSCWKLEVHGRIGQAASRREPV
jgi:single-strand DNA-binding protein